APARLAIRYMIVQPIADPTAADKAYTGINALLRALRTITATSGPPGNGTSAESSSDMPKTPNAPSPISHSASALSSAPSDKTTAPVVTPVIVHQLILQQPPFSNHPSVTILQGLII